MDFGPLLELKLPSGEYAVFGGATLALHGIRDTQDIDIIVTPSLWRDLREKYGVSKSKPQAVQIGIMEIFDNFRPCEDDVGELIRRAEIINGIPTVQLADVIQWKLKMARPKDLYDIQLIENYLRK